MSDISDFVHTIQLRQIGNKVRNTEELQSAILYELRDLKHLKKTGRTLQEQAERDAEIEYQLTLQERREEADRWNALSDDEKYTEDFNQYVAESVWCGFVCQCIFQVFVFNIEIISSSLKNIFIMEVSGILFHIMLQCFRHSGFVNNWKPRRK